MLDFKRHFCLKLDKILNKHEGFNINHVQSWILIASSSIVVQEIIYYKRR